MLIEDRNPARYKSNFMSNKLANKIQFIEASYRQDMPDGMNKKFDAFYFF